MNKGAWLFALFAGGYVVFELSMLHKMRHRMEVDHILHQMVSAEHAVVSCDGATGSQREKYGKRIASLKVRAARELAELQPELGEAEIVQFIDDEIATIRQQVDAAISAQGCDGPEVAVYRKRFKIYAGRS